MGNRHWLQPLLDQLILNPRTLAMPMLDGISQTNWHSYSAMPPGHWRFEWNMNLVYTNPGNFYRSDQAEPYDSPATSGGIFAMRKDWFEELRLFDEGMLHWGGDHVELSMKVWRCGGRIEIVPCSRIGHLFRDPEHRPYDVAVMQVVKNYARLAQVLWKDHLDYFYRMKPEAVDMEHEGLEEAKAKFSNLTERLDCKDHAWYHENIDYEMAFEMDRICHPHVHDKSSRDHCKAKLLPGRWTVTVEDAIPTEEYL